MKRRWTFDSTTSLFSSNLVRECFDLYRGDTEAYEKIARTSRDRDHANEIRTKADLKKKKRKTGRIQSRVKFYVTIFNPSIVTQVASVAANFQPDTASHFENVPLPVQLERTLFSADWGSNVHYKRTRERFG